MTQQTVVIFAEVIMAMIIDRKIVLGGCRNEKENIGHVVVILGHSGAEKGQMIMVRN